MRQNGQGFTLIEILIVVLILAILAAIVIPQFVNASEESKLSNLTSNLQAIRAQLELYKMHHNETYPTNINTQLTSKTDSDGSINPAGLYGPYLHMFPANPFCDDPVKAVKTEGKSGEGWEYDKDTGVIVPNTD
jgi:general secretion pathway protein G